MGRYVLYLNAAAAPVACHVKNDPNRTIDSLSQGAACFGAVLHIMLTQSKARISLRTDLQPSSHAARCFHIVL
jgi:hypothetical protein